MRTFVPEDPDPERVDGEQGQVAPLLAFVLVAMVAALFVLGQVAAVVTDRARARTAADAAALAGAAAGHAEATEIAQVNGGALVSWVEVGHEVEVTVEVGRAQASARARREVG